MNGNNLFLDTNIVLYLLSGDKTLADLLYKKQLFISIITEMELLAYPKLKKSDEETLKKFIKECRVVTLNNDIKNEAIRLRKIYNIKLPDSIIAASAIYLDFPLISADKDFGSLKELSLLHYT